MIPLHGTESHLLLHNKCSRPWTGARWQLTTRVLILVAPRRSSAGWSPLWRWTTRSPPHRRNSANTHRDQTVRSRQDYMVLKLKCSESPTCRDAWAIAGGVCPVGDGGRCAMARQRPAYILSATAMASRCRLQLPLPEVRERFSSRSALAPAPGFSGSMGGKGPKAAASVLTAQQTGNAICSTSPARAQLA